MTGARITPEAYPEWAEAAASAVGRRGMLDRERLRSTVPFSRLFPDTPTPRPVQQEVITLAGQKGTKPGL